jgi:hypothetical protein
VGTIERLVTFVLSQYRWGLHPLKLLVALILPILFVWLADRHVRVRSATLDSSDARRDFPPRRLDA